MAKIVDSAVHSTRAYLEFLNRQKPVTKHNATEICLHEDGDSFLENELWKTYRCRLPSHQSVLSDSPATMISDALPANALEIRILEYDRRSGLTKFAAQTEITGQTGHVLIDFRWLVKRCLEWLELNGPAIPEISEIPTLAPGPADPWAAAGGLSDAQREAIKTALTAKLSYIWGAPGTGKTKWVLAKAVRYCVDQNRKVLVLAPTNLAVDNALAAILNEGVEKDKVARLGVPSEDFIRQFRECCEERAFHHEIRQIKSQIKIREDNITSIEREQCLTKQTKEKEGEIDHIRTELEIHNAHLNAIEKCLQDTCFSISNTREKWDSLEAQRVAKRREADALSFPDLVAHVRTLESEQVETIAHIKTLETELRHLGFFSRMFTRRKHEIGKLIESQNSHLQCVEGTLEAKRNKRDELAPVATELEEEMAALVLSCDEAQREIAVLQDGQQDSARTQQNLARSILQLQEDLHRAEGQLEKASTELQRLRTLPLAGLTDEVVQVWRSEIRQLEAELLHFKQDLSQKSVLGMTLDGFIGLTLQKSVNIDQVFVDEAPYAPLAKILPLLKLRCPIAMLGDHLQLPPVCECDNDPTIRAYWAKPAIFLEDAFRPGMTSRALCALEEPRFEITQKCTLTTSYRFGQSLAALLDEYIYKRIGLKGLAEDDTFIECVNCVPGDGEAANKRENAAEASSIVKYVKELSKRTKEAAKMPTIGILTPYLYQANLIRRMVKSASWDSVLRDRVEIWNTHKAQGREWDWVLFSVVDTGRLRRNEPWFTDSALPQGRAVLNTTISRAKHHLVVFLDVDYWERRIPESLLVEMVRSHGGTRLTSWE